MYQGKQSKLGSWKPKTSWNSIRMSLSYRPPCVNMCR